MSEEKRDICKVCGREVGYYKIDKGNGKSTHRAIHIGDSVPENATEVSKYSVSSTYRNRMRQVLEHKGVIIPEVASGVGQEGSDSIITKPETDSSSEIEVLLGKKEQETSTPEVPKLITKEKADQPVHEYTEIHEFPEGSEDKPEIDVSEVRRNKFAVIGAIARKLSEVGKPEKDVSEIRSYLIARGINFQGVIHMASEHLRFVENGQPLFFK